MDFTEKDILLSEISFYLLYNVCVSKNGTASKNGSAKWPNHTEFINQVTQSQPKGSVVLSVKKALSLFKNLDLNEFLSGHLDWAREHGRTYAKFEVVIGDTISLSWQENPVYL